MKALLIGYIWPEPRSSAAGLRSLSLIRALREGGYDVEFASPAKDGPAAEELRAQGVATHFIRPNDSEFDALVARLAPDVVVFERFMMEEQFGWRVASASPESLRVLDTVDLHFLRRQRQAAIASASGATHAGPADDSTDDAFREIASIYRCDQTLVISEHELALLTDVDGPYRLPPRLLQEFSFCYDEPPRFNGEEARRDFAFIGTFRHDPNTDAVHWLHQEVWPEIRKLLPGAVLRVYGAYAPREIAALDRPDFRVLGQAPDQYAALGRALVNLAPLRFGAGLKGKIADGWWAGTPCVATRLGAEGMSHEGRFGGLIVPNADGAEAFAQAAARLYRDEALRSQAREDGYRIVREKFGHAANSRRWLARISALRAGLAEHRHSNFTGRMLAHHSHRSTEYFSRWIEGKQRPVQA